MIDDLINPEISPWLRGLLAAFPDGGEWSFGITDFIDGENVLFVGDRIIKLDNSLVCCCVEPGMMKKEGGLLVGKRFKSRDEALLAGLEFLK